MHADPNIPERQAQSHKPCVYGIKAYIIKPCPGAENLMFRDLMEGRQKKEL